MIRALLLLATIVLLKGAFVSAVETQMTVAVTPDKSFYHPGEMVTLHVQASANDAVRVEARVSYLTATITTLSAPLVNGQADLTWQPPSDSPRGYGLDLTVYRRGRCRIGDRFERLRRAGSLDSSAALRLPQRLHPRTRERCRHARLAAAPSHQRLAVLRLAVPLGRPAARDERR